MSDFTTQLEDGEMVKVREIFERALNAIVAASQFAKELTQLRTEFNVLKQDLESYRARATELENELALVRDARDQALRDKAAAIAELNHVQQDFQNGQQNYDTLQAAHNQLSDKHEALKHEHDNVQLSNMQLEEEITKLKGQLEKVKAVFGIQPRDPVTGKWDSPTVVLAEPSPEQADQPKTGTDPYWR